MFEVNKHQFFSFCNESKLSTEGTKWGLRDYHRGAGLIVTL